MQCRPIGGEHGVSCVFPTLNDILEFEKNTLLTDRGYPRFVMHPAVSELIKREGNPLRFPVCSTGAARFLRDGFSFLPDTKILERDGYALLECPDTDTLKQLSADARNCGFTLSSRRAAAILNNEQTEPDGNLIPAVKKKIAGFESGSAQEWIRLLPSGMAGLLTLMIASVNGSRSGITMVDYPYVDTRILMDKISGRIGAGGIKTITADQKIQEGLSCSTGLLLLELPTNPLGRIADLENAVSEAHRQGTAVAVDATVATPYNFHPFQWGIDAVIHSTTKFLNGKNDHLGGALLINPESGFRDALMKQIDNFLSQTAVCMDPREAEVLHRNLDGFPKRMSRINSTAPQIAEWLEKHPAVERVWYPGLKSHPDYKKACRYLPEGFGGVLSFVLKKSSFQQASLFYDNCSLPGKGPSLGGEQSLLCPITMLTDFDADDAELKRLGQDRYTMRLSVGTEPFVELTEALAEGLDRCRGD